VTGCLERSQTEIWDPREVRDQSEDFADQFGPCFTLGVIKACADREGGVRGSHNVYVDGDW
jgi:hypothetical protein